MTFLTGGVCSGVSENIGEKLEVSEDNRPFLESVNSQDLHFLMDITTVSQEIRTHGSHL